jgi:hypothetical protein
MRRAATLAIAALAVLLIASQFAIPPLIASKVEDRLTADGGTAEVELHAFPALRLLFGEGSLARVRAREIELPLAPPGKPVLDAIDGFGEVDVQITDSHAGPVEVDELSLRRGSADEVFRASVRGSVTARDAGTFAGGFLGGLAAGMLPFGDKPLTFDLDAALRSEGGRPHVVTVHGDLGGLPAGPLVEALAQALAGRF